MFETSNTSSLLGGHTIETSMFQLGGGNLPIIPVTKPTEWKELLQMVADSSHTPKSKR
jgi:hypothetical protein